MLVPRSKIFMQWVLFVAFVWKERCPYFFKGHHKMPGKGIMPYFKQTSCFTFSEGANMHSHVLKGKHQRDCFQLKSLFISGQ